MLGFFVDQVHRTKLVIFAMLLSAIGLIASPTPAQEAVRESTSLQFVPADVAFFSSSLRLREQYDLVAKSQAMKQLLEMPVLQQGLQQLNTLWNDDGNQQVAIAKAVLDQPENKQLVELLKDLGSHEMFSYGDASFIELFRFANQLSGAMRSAQIEGLENGDGSDKAMAKKTLEVVAKFADQFKLPDMVMGFKLSDPKPATDQMARLEPLGRLLGAFVPQLQGRFHREKIGEADFLTLELDGSLLPWDKFQKDLDDPKYDDNREQIEKLIAKAKKMTLAITLGVRGNYLLLSIGDSNQHLAALGQGKLLLDRPEFAALVKAGAKRYTSIAYVSGEFLEAANSSKQQLSQLVEVAEKLLPKSDLSQTLQEELIADAKSFRDQLFEKIPQASSILAYSFLTAHGYEAFACTWPSKQGLDGSKRLTLLDHVGTNPIFFAVARGKHSPDDAAFVEKWSQRAVYYYEKIALEKIDAEQKAQVEKIRAEFTPLVKRLYKNTRDVLLPALADGQVGVVLDAKSTSAKWFKDMPAADKPLPMLELGLLAGVSDANGLKKAFVDYYAVVQEAINKLHVLYPDKIPAFKLPLPESSDVGSGVIYFYPLPDKAGVDKAIVPNAGVSKEVAAISGMPLFTTRLLEKSTLAASGLLDQGKQPLASASYFNHAAFIDAITPWIEYGVNQIDSKKDAPTEADGEMSAAAILKQVRIGLRFLQCFRGMTSVSYYEGSSHVHHSEWRFEDAK